MTQRDEPEEAVERPQYLTVEVAGVEHGVAVLAVREVLQHEHVTPVPSMPRAVRGVINLRGRVVPVLDLAARFGLATTSRTRRTCIVIAEVRLDGQPAVMGLLVDAVRQVIELGPDEIDPPPPFGTKVKVEYLVGIGKVAADRFVLLLDVDRVVTAAEQGLAPEVAGAAPGSEARSET